MAQIQLKDGKFLLVGGEIAVDPACCCLGPCVACAGCDADHQPPCGIPTDYCTPSVIRATMTGAVEVLGDCIYNGNPFAPVSIKWRSTGGDPNQSLLLVRGLSMIDEFNGSYCGLECSWMGEGSIGLVKDIWYKDNCDGDPDASVEYTVIRYFIARCVGAWVFHAAIFTAAFAFPQRFFDASWVATNCNQADDQPYNISGPIGPLFSPTAVPIDGTGATVSFDFCDDGMADAP